MAIQSQIILDSPSASREDARRRPSYTAPGLENAFIEIEGKRYNFLELLEPLMEQPAR